MFTRYLSGAVLTLIAGTAASAECPFSVDVLARNVPIATGFTFTEGPVWTGADWLFSDIPADTIYRLTRSGEIMAAYAPSGWANGNVLRRDGTLVSARHDRSVVAWRESGDATVLADHFGAGWLNSPNDIVEASDGTLYFTDPPFGISGYGPQIAEEEQPVRGIYRLDPDGTVSRLSGALSMPNGLALEAGETSLLVTDTERGTIHRLALDGPDTSPEIVAKIAPGIDGLKIDDAGRIFLAEPGGIGVYEDGRRVCAAPLDADHVSNVALGDGEVLVTASDRLFLLPIKQ